MKANFEYCVGYVKSVSFIACTSGNCINILDSNFEKISQIVATDHVDSIDSSKDIGRIAASIRNQIFIYEPKASESSTSKSSPSHTPTNEWIQTAVIASEHSNNVISFNIDGTKLIAGGRVIQIWSIDNSSPPTWTCIWRCRPANPIFYLKYSPDGSLFCSAGKSDKNVKIWFENRTSNSILNYSFIYLTHPKPITSLEWRRTSKYAPQNAVANILITSCKDNVARIWIQTLLPVLLLFKPGVHFHLAQTLSGLTLLHWLNNKEIHITRSIEFLLNDMLTRILKSNTESNILTEEFDRNLEQLLKEWQTSTDLLFSINKLDGSFSLWEAKYLDGEDDGIFRNIQITRIAKLKSKLPELYATTLSQKVIVFSPLEDPGISLDSEQRPKYLFVNQHLNGILSLWNLDLEYPEIKNLSLVSRITGLPLASAWLRDGYLQVENKQAGIYTEWLDDEKICPNILVVDILKASKLSTSLTIFPQYHPKQLTELLTFGKLKRVKAILNHLTSYLVATDLSKSTNPIKPLPIYSLLEVDNEEQKTERASKDAFINELKSVYRGRSSVEETLDEILGQSTLDTMKEQKKQFDQFSADQSTMLTHFDSQKASTLTNILTHTHLAEVSNIEQIQVLAVADTVIMFDSLHTTSLDDKGLRFLTAMRQYIYLTKCLPINQRSELKSNGVGTHNIVWAFHSESQEDLLDLIPSVKTNKPEWSELREFGVGWWVRKLDTLKKIIEKTAQHAYQSKQDPLDAALFYLAMKKKTLVCALLRRINCDKRLLKLFEQDFSDPSNRRKALKNAYALLGLHRFEHAAAFFILAGSIWDAVEVCINNLNDIQLAVVLVRLYDGEHNVSENLKRLLYNEILGIKTKDIEPLVYNIKMAHPDPFLRSIAFYQLGDYSLSFYTLIDTECLQKNDLVSVFNFYLYMRSNPMVQRHKTSLQDTEEQERQLLLREADIYLKSGYPLLALEILTSDTNSIAQTQLLKFKSCLFLLLNELNTVPIDSELLREWFDKSLGALKDLCSYQEKSDAIMRTMLTYCNLNCAKNENLIAVRKSLIEFIDKKNNEQ